MRARPRLDWHMILYEDLKVLRSKYCALDNGAWDFGRGTKRVRDKISDIRIVGIKKNREGLYQEGVLML